MKASVLSPKCLTKTGICGFSRVHPQDLKNATELKSNVPPSTYFGHHASPAKPLNLEFELAGELHRGGVEELRHKQAVELGRKYAFLSLRVVFLVTGEQINLIAIPSALRWTSTLTV